jgi:hypothetical protein
MKNRNFSSLMMATLTLAVILLIAACTPAEPAELDPTPTIAVLVQDTGASAQPAVEEPLEDPQEEPAEPADDPEPVKRPVITLMQSIYRHPLENLDALPTLGVPGDDEPDDILLLVQLTGLEGGQDPADYEVQFAINGVTLQKTITPVTQVGDGVYWALDQFPMPFDANDHVLIKLEAWVDLPSGGEIRHVVEEVFLANCGWSATLSGGKSGEIKGDLTFPTETFTGATAEQLAELADAGYFGPTGEDGSDMPSTDELSSGPVSYMLGNRQTFPYIQIIPGQAAIGMLELNNLSFGEQVSVNMDINDDVQKDGSFSIDLMELMTMSSFVANGEFFWHVASLCSMDVIIEIGRNPYPDGLVPVGLP